MPNFRAPFAQTIIQLFNQLTEAGYEERELRQIKDAWMLAQRLFACRVAGNGKIFLSHVVGAASVLASVKAHPVLVSAAMLHNAYGNARFLDGSGGASESHRKFVRRGVGQEVELLVFRFWSERWDADVLQTWLQQDRLEPRQKDLLTVRMADAIEHAGMLGLQYKGAKRNLEFFDQVREPMMALARKYGLGALAEAWLREISRYDRHTVPPEVAAQSPARSVVVLPASYMGNLRQKLRRLRARSRPKN